MKSIYGSKMFYIYRHILIILIVIEPNLEFTRLAGSTNNYHILFSNFVIVVFIFLVLLINLSFLFFMQIIHFLDIILREFIKVSKRIFLNFYKIIYYLKKIFLVKKSNFMKLFIANVTVNASSGFSITISR